MNGITFTPRVSPAGSQEQTTEVFIPSEILLMICWNLEKCDWKSMRLVSRTFNYWSNCLPLITELWFNPQPQDLKVFEAVCATPHLKKHVTTILFDTTDYESGGHTIKYAQRRVARQRLCERVMSFWNPSNCRLLKDLDFLNDAMIPRRLDQVASILSRGMKMLPNQ